MKIRIFKIVMPGHDFLDGRIVVSVDSHKTPDQIIEQFAKYRGLKFDNEKKLVHTWNRIYSLDIREITNCVEIL